MKKFFAFLCVIILSTRAASSEQADKHCRAKEEFISSAGNGGILELTLADSLARALENNLDIKISRMEPKIRRYDLISAKAGFEPSFNLSYQKQDSFSYSSVIIDTSPRESVSAGISGKFPSGTKYSLDLSESKLRNDTLTYSFNPYYKTEPSITLTHPLLRGAGLLINKAGIIIASNYHRASLEGFKKTVSETVAKTQTSYYNCYYAKKRKEIAETARAWTAGLLETMKQRFEKGMASAEEVMEIEAALAVREKEVYAARADMYLAQDNLKSTTNIIEDPQYWDMDIKITEGPKVNPKKIDLAQSLANAFANRPDYLAAKKLLENQDIKTAQARNDTLPSLDLTGSAGLNSMGESYKDSMEGTSSNRHSWSIGVKFTMPWGSGERAVYIKNKLEKMQAELDIRRMEQQIRLEVRFLAREAKNRYLQLKASHKILVKETAVFAAQEKRFALGQIDAHDLLDYRIKFINAQADYQKAAADYNIALINLEKAEGLTLAKNNITLE